MCRFPIVMLKCWMYMETNYITHSLQITINFGCEWSITFGYSQCRSWREGKIANTIILWILLVFSKDFIISIITELNKLSSLKKETLVSPPETERTKPCEQKHGRWAPMFVSTTICCYAFGFTVSAWMNQIKYWDDK